MRSIYVYREGKWQEKQAPSPSQQNQGPFTWSDLEGYVSPVGTGWIEGRSARREDLKRAGCREVGPNEFNFNTQK